jgi:hypothetical protein
VGAVRWRARVLPVRACRCKMALEQAFEIVLAIGRGIRRGRGALQVRLVWARWESLGLDGGR